MPSVIVINRQAMDVGQLLTTLDDDQCDITKLFSVQSLDKSCRGNYDYLRRYSNFTFVW